MGKPTNISKIISKKLEKLIKESGWNICLEMSNDEYGGLFDAPIECLVAAFEIYLKTGENELYDILAHYATNRR